MRQPNLKSIATRLCLRYLPIIALSLFFSFNMSAQDIIKPVLNCPGPINIQLLPGECNSTINYAVSATDNTDPNPVISLINGLPSGASFPIGTTMVQYQATDVAGNTDNCTFDVIVNVYNNGTSTIECQQVVNLSLDNNCQAFVTPAYLLKGLYGCYDNFSVQIADTNGNSVPQLIDNTYLGQQLTVTVIDNATGLTCSGLMNVEDYSAPTIECNDAAVFCYEGTTPDDLPQPTAYDNCDSNPDLTYTDIVTSLNCSVPINGGYFLSKIDRTWTATDNRGLSNSCTQTIYTKRVFVYDIECPKNADNIKSTALDCTDNPNDLTLTGQPTLNGIPVDDLTSCNLSVSYTDSIANICGSSFRIYRNWTMIDLCPDGEVVYTFPYQKGIIQKTQVLDFLDTTAPTFSCPDSLSIGTTSNNCTGTLIIPAVNVFDDCANVTVSTVTPDGIAHNGNGGITLADLTIGTHNIVYVAKDDCGNVSSCTVPVVVHDCIAPVIACVADLTVSVNNSGVNEVCATQLDAGSTDNCGNLTFEIRRADSVFGSPYTSCVNYGCEEVNSTFQVDMITRDEYGNEDECTVTIHAIDDVLPTIHCPADISLDCLSDYTDLSLTGIATASDVCGVQPITHLDNVVNGRCGLDTIFRTFTVLDIYGNANTCEQTIVQINLDPFYISDTDATNADPNDGVEWPANYSTACGNTNANILPSALPSSPINFAQPKLFFYRCDEVQLTYTDSLISGNINDCYSLARKWLIIDWCNYDPANPTAGGTHEYIQTISVGDTEAPIFTSDCADVSFCNFDLNCGLTFAHLEATASDNCSADADLDYFYSIDLHNDGNINTTGNGNTIDDLYPLGQHKVIFEVNDGCGNISACEYFFTIADCVNPTVKCQQNIAINLGANGTYIIAATELDSGNTFDNCTAYNELIFSFSNDVLETTFELNCEHEGTYGFELWVTDLYGNIETCNATVVVNDPTGACDPIVIPDPLYSIAGYIQDESGNMIEDVDVNISNGMAGLITTDMTGDYLFPSLPINNNYTVTPSKDANLLNGVTTLDLVLITRHILGVQPLTSPYKIIAADVNHSNSVSTLDVVNLQRVILGLDNDFANNTSWRFVDMDFVFPSAINPFATNFPEVISYNNLSADELFTDFIAVKIGDVNNTAAASLRTLETRDDSQLDFEVVNTKLKKGQEYTIDISTDQLNELLGYQMTLQLPIDKVELIKVVPGKISGMSIDNFGTQQMDRGVITTNWFTPNLLDAKESTVLFGLTIKAKTDIEIKDILTLGDAPVLDQAYTENKEGIDQSSIGFNFNDLNESTDNAQTELSNSPNPFKEQTTITFNLEQNDNVSLVILDLNGRTILEQNTNFSKGSNQLMINSTSLKGSGIYYYQLKSKEFSITKKMILLE